MNRFVGMLVLLMVSCSLTFAQEETTLVDKKTKVVPIQKPKEAITGFQILTLEKGSTYEKLGLKQGDVIKSYNGKTIKNTKDGMKVYDSMITDRKIDLVVERNGQTQKLHYEVK